MLSALGVAVVMPVIAEPSHTSATFPSNGRMAEDTTYVNQATYTNLHSYEAPVVATANYTLNEYVVNAGQYLPADAEEAVLCPAGSACGGGTYTFNENANQGIVECVAGTYSPTGSAECYPHILHIGNDNVYLKSTKTTNPALNIRIGNDVFYANMTTTQTALNRDTTRQLKIEYNNNIYYVCDDSVCGQ